MKEDADPSQIAHKVGSAERTQPLLHVYHMFDKAHVVMLIEERLVPNNDGKAILRAFREMEEMGGRSNSRVLAPSQSQPAQ